MPPRFDEDRRNKYARSAQAWLVLVAQATQRRTTTYDALESWPESGVSSAVGMLGVNKLNKRSEG